METHKKNLNQRAFIFILPLLIVVIWYACAVTGNPTGGPRDETPPVLDSIKSTPGLQTFFTEKNYVFYFDEFIQANNLVGKIIVSPPLEYIPKMEVRGKRLKVELNEKEVLKENATYIFNFGDGIGDFRENNRIENFTFVFSTGPIIDSLSFSGSVVDAYSGEPVKDVYVMLYDNLQDSVVYKEKPFYFSITDAEGNYRFQNIRSDSFKLFALQDANLNYKYDQNSERIGFYEDIIYLTDTFDLEIDLEIFQEFSTNRFLKTHSSKNGMVKLLYSEDIHEVIPYSIEGDAEIIWTSVNKDTLLIWYFMESKDFNVILPKDTVKVRPVFDVDYSKIELRRIVSPRPVAISLSPVDSLKLEFIRPVVSVSDTLYAVDTSGNRVKIDWAIVGNTIRGKGRWRPGRTYQLEIPPGMVMDYYGSVNDTVRQEFNVLPIDDFGDIYFTLTGLDTLHPYVVTLYKGEEGFRKQTVSGMDSVEIKFMTLQPGEYRLGILEDRNGNGRWDPGSYMRKEQAERIRFIKLDALRASWDLQAAYKWEKDR